MTQKNEKVDPVGDGEATENEPTYDPNDRSTWDYIPFKYQLTGVATINMIEVVIATVLTWLLSLLLHLDMPISDMLEVTIVGGLIACIPEAALQTAVSKRERTWASHNWGMVIARTLIYCVVLLVTAYLVNHQGYWYVIVIVATLFDAFMGVRSNMVKPEPGMTEKESQLHKSAEMKKMTEETFGDDIDRMKAKQHEKLDRYNDEHGINKLHWHRK